MKTLLIGIDAAAPGVLESVFDDGAADTLQRLWTSGTSGRLESQIPPWTASAWPSLYTGKNPGKHGVFGFLQFDGYDWTVVNASNVGARTLWEFLDFHGYTSVVVNVPVTHPPRPFDGALVPGYTAPERPTCHPEGTLETVEDAIGEYRVYAPSEDLDDAAQLDWFRRLTRMRGRAFRALADRHDPDFGFVQFQQTDTVFHKRPGDDEAVRTVYREVDDQIDRIIDECNPENVIVASDHGMGRCEGETFYLNEFLADEGFLTERRGGEGMPSWVTVREENLRQGTDSVETDAGYAGRVVAGLAKAGLTTERVATVLDTLGLTEAVARRVPASLQRAGTRQVDFANSQAYARDSIELGVRINLAGREPDGVVPRSDYESVRSDLIDRLSAVETPGGERVFAEVGPREDYFEGPATAGAVDVVTVPADFDYQLSTRLDGDQFGPVREPYHHKMDGVVAVSGPGIDAGASVAGATIFDVAPTVLATFGVPYDAEMDGEPLPVVADAGRRGYPTQDEQARVVTDDVEVEDRLADLGYIERT